MTNYFKSWVLHVFALHLALLRTDRLRRETIDLTVQLAGLITITFPIFLVIGGTAALFAHTVPWESVQIPVAIAFLVVVLGVSQVTDRIYDRNIQIIERNASTIKNDPKFGPWWAARRLLVLYTASVITVLVIYKLIRLYGL